MSNTDPHPIYVIGGGCWFNCGRDTHTAFRRLGRSSHQLAIVTLRLIRRTP